MRLSKISFERQRTTIVQNCLVQLTLSLECIPKVVIRLGVVRLERQAHHNLAIAFEGLGCRSRISLYLCALALDPKYVEA